MSLLTIRHFEMKLGVSSFHSNVSNKGEKKNDGVIHPKVNRDHNGFIRWNCSIKEVMELG